MGAMGIMGGDWAFLHGEDELGGMAVVVDGDGDGDGARGTVGGKDFFEPLVVIAEEDHATTESLWHLEGKETVGIHTVDTEADEASVGREAAEPVAVGERDSGRLKRGTLRLTSQGRGGSLLFRRGKRYWRGRRGPSRFWRGSREFFVVGLDQDVVGEDLADAPYPLPDGLGR